jgi:hypothetical protein
MPTLACRICGRVVYTAAALESLFAEERRCPRCGGMLFTERRDDNRRKTERRQDAEDAPGPPDNFENRTSDRRRMRRRRDDRTAF